MKHVLVSLLILIAILLGSCGNKRSALTNNEVIEPFSFEIKKKKLIDELMLLTSKDFSSEFLATNPNTTLIICPSKNGEKYVITIDPEGSE